MSPTAPLTTGSRRPPALAVTAAGAYWLSADGEIERLSHSAAAARLDLPKSTLSRRIAALEKLLGERLLQRTTRQLSVTDFGEGVLAHARAVSAEVEEATALATCTRHVPSPISLSLAVLIQGRVRHIPAAHSLTGPTWAAAQTL